MNKNFLEFARGKIRELFQAYINLFIFLPYFFSVPELLKTLLKPWKNLYSKKVRPGFSADEWIGRVSFNAISVGLGIVMRLSIIFFYFILDIFLILFLPIFTPFYILSLPIFFFITTFEESDQEKYNRLKKAFFKNRLLKPENEKEVEQWFEFYFRTEVKKAKWWELSRLFSIPPLARDWSSGFTPTLDQYGEELTTYKPHYRHLVGREAEIKQIERILSKSVEANVIVVGEEGVGKHTIIEALSKRIYEGRINSLLAYKRIFKIDLEKIFAESKDKSQKENTLKGLLGEAQDARNIIILIDNFHKYLSQGNLEADTTSIISQFAPSVKLQFIAISTPFNYQKYIFTNEKINRFFEKVEVKEVGKNEALNILLTNVFDFEKRFKLTIPYETLMEVIVKSDFYITYIPYPEKAIDLLDRILVYASEISKKTGQLIVTPDMVSAVLTEKTKIPVNISPSFKTKLLSIEKMLFEKIVYQKEPIEKLAATIRKSFVLGGSRKKSLASFLFLGPTGVGKTETAKVLSRSFFSSENKLTRFDMSFYQTKDSINDLVGSAESGSPGQLTVAIRENPYSLLLLDEIEKSDKNILNIFLTLLDEGYFVDGYGRRVDCKNLIIIATSNAESDFIFDLLNKSTTDSEISQKLIDHLIEKKIFSPEFLNRFDGVIVFKPLSKEATFEIAKKLIGKVANEAYKLYGVRLRISQKLMDQLIQKGYSRQFGARNLERAIRDEIEDKIARLVLTNKINSGEIITL